MAKTGRPQKSASEKQRYRIDCYLNREEFAEIKIKCELAGLSASSFLRDLALNKEIRVRSNSDELKKIRAELGRIGGNINQIAKKVNTGGKFDEANFKKLSADLINLMKKL